ncbi:MAG TPA: hypothetical protein P5065_03555 [Candidatus Ratteibacteria bacterium]|nr:hypothetical protein [bacterium]HPC29939.1 hypothetical protein [bacterium]HRS06103.1 hypothetical protein [Candidatus Ratteibacteria bacterium]HRV04074.1 hypothetical protein [Candidatus Ratteibacteria bacterium]
MEQNKKKKSKPEAGGGNKKVSIEKINIRCRTCFVIDGYALDEKNCRHCGSRLFLIDRY